MVSDETLWLAANVDSVAMDELMVLYSDAKLKRFNISCLQYFGYFNLLINYLWFFLSTALAVILSSHILLLLLQYPSPTLNYKKKKKERKNRERQKTSRCNARLGIYNGEGGESEQDSSIPIDSPLEEADFKPDSNTISALSKPSYLHLDFLVNNAKTHRTPKIITIGKAVVLFLFFFICSSSCAAGFQPNSR